MPNVSNEFWNVHAPAQYQLITLIKLMEQRGRAI